MYSLRSKLPKANTQNIEPRWSSESLHHIGWKFGLIRIWKLQNLKLRDKSIARKLSCTYHWDILVSCTIQCHNNLLLNFRSIYLFCGHLREVNLHFKWSRLLTKRWSLTRSSKYSVLTWKLSVFWKTGDLQEVVATGDSTVFSVWWRVS